jgi:hypothetical protein
MKETELTIEAAQGSLSKTLRDVVEKIRAHDAQAHLARMHLRDAGAAAEWPRQRKLP